MDGNGVTQDEADYSTLPLQDRLVHKLWRARQQAYDELAQEFQRADSRDGIFREHAHDTIRKLMSESNAAALDSALNCMQAFLENCDGQFLGKQLKAVLLGGIVEKGLTAAKASTRGKSSEAILKFIEKAEGGEAALVAEILPFVSHKSPKLVAAALAMIASILRDFGRAVLGGSPAAVLTALQQPVIAAFGNADKTVRAEATAVTLEIFRIAGAGAIGPILAGLKPIQVKEIQDQTAQAQPASTIRRYLRGQAPIAPVHASNAEMDVDGEEGEQEAVVESVANVDPFETAIPMPFLPNIPESFYEQVESGKWSERKEALDSLVNLLAPMQRLEINGQHYGEIMGCLAKRIADVNVLVTISAATVVSHLGRTLRKGLTPCRGLILPALIERCKERKQSVVDAIRAALDSLAWIMPDAICEMIAPDSALHTALSNKNPQIRTETAQWIRRMLLQRRSNSKDDKKEVKALADSFCPLLDDGTVEVRDAATAVLAQVIRIYGAKAVSPFIAQLDKVKMAKLTAAVDADMKERKDEQPAETRVAKVARVEKQPTSTTSNTSSNGNTGSTPKQAVPVATKEEVISMKHTNESAEQLFRDSVPVDVFDNLQASNWKDRLNACEALAEGLKNNGILGLAGGREALVRFVGQRPGLKDANVMVVAKVLSVIRGVIEGKPQLAEVASVMLAADYGLIERLSDAKVGGEVSEILLSLVQGSSLDLVISAVLRETTAKNPKLLGDLLKWCETTVEAFGGVFTPHTDAPYTGSKLIGLAVEFTKPLLSHAVAQVRASALAFMVALRVHLGPEVKRQMQDASISANHLSSIDAASSRKPAAPSKHYVSLVSSSTPVEANSMVPDAPSASTAEPAAPVIHMADVLVHLASPTLCAKLTDADWKVRKDALESLLAHCTTLTACQPQAESVPTGVLAGLTAMQSALKQRLNDTNKNLVATALEACGLLAKGLGIAQVDPSRLCRMMLQSILDTLADNKITVRQQATRCLDYMLESACRSSSTLAYFVPVIGSTLLNSESPNVRKELATWFAAIPTGMTPETVSILQTGLMVNASTDLHSILPALASLLGDRTAEVRKCANAVLPALLTLYPPEAVQRKLAELNQKDANVAALTALFKPIFAERLTAAAPAHPGNAAAGAGSPRKLKAPVLSASTVSSLLREEVSMDISTPALEIDLARMTDTQVAQLHQCIPIGRILDIPTRRAACHAAFTLLLSPPSVPNALLPEPHESGSEIASLHMALLALDKAIHAGSSESTVIQGFPALMMYTNLLLDGYSASLQMQIDALMLVESLLAVLDGQNQRLGEMEAVLLMPRLISKLAITHDEVRLRLHRIFRQTCLIYPASKVLACLFDGTLSSDARIRAETLQEISSLLNRQGTRILNPSVHIPILGRLYNDTESAAVRRGAYTILLHLIGATGGETAGTGLEATVLRLLEESPSTHKAAQALRERSPQIGEDSSSSAAVKMDDSNASGVPMEVDQPVDLNSHELPHLRSLEFTQTRGGDMTHYQHPLDLVLLDLQTGHDGQALTAITQLHEMADKEAFRDALLARRVPLLTAIMIRFADCSRAGSDDVKGKLARGVIEVLGQLGRQHAVFKELPLETMVLIISAGLRLMSSDPNGVSSPTSVALNYFLVSLFESANRADTIVSLLTILRDSYLAEHFDEQLVGLLFKCMWKNLRGLGDMLKDPVTYPSLVGVPARLLPELDRFLAVLPPAFWGYRGRNGAPHGDMPLKVIRMILSDCMQCPQLSGEVHSAFAQLLDNSGDFRDLAVEAPAAAIALAQSTMARLPSPFTGGKNTLTERLHDICETIFTRKDTRLGVTALRDLLDRCGDEEQLEVWRVIASLGPHFERYLKRALETHLNAPSDDASVFSERTAYFKQRLAEARSHLAPAATTGGLCAMDYESAAMEPSSENLEIPSSEQQQAYGSPYKGTMNSPLRSRLQYSLGKMQSAHSSLSQSSSHVNEQATTPAAPDSLLSIKERLAILRSRATASFATYIAPENHSNSNKD